MFTSARLKLTLWYFLIISVITLLFSVAVYRGLTMEFTRIVRTQRFRQDRVQLYPAAPPDSAPIGSPTMLKIDSQLIEESKERIRLAIFLADLGILAASTIAAYFLAGRTLAPIEEMVEEQKRFTADASHELRTPLTAIKSEIEVALRDKNLKLPEAKALLKSNLEEVDKLKSLSDSLLDLNKYQGANVSLAFEMVDLKKLISQVIGQVSSLAKVKKINLKTEVSDLIFSGNPNTLSQLLVILLDNAIKFSKDGGKVVLKGKAADGELILSVIDNGIGIEEAQLPFIFKRFYQADQSREKREEGYGLGLSIAKRIVDLHGGEIGAESKPGKGTTLTVKLPVSHR